MVLKQGCIFELIEEVTISFMGLNLGVLMANTFSRIH